MLVLYFFASHPITLNYPVSDILESQYKIEVKLKTFGDYREKKK